MWPVWPERKQEGGDDITQENVMMNDDGDDCGDVDGDKCWSKVTYPQFDVFFPFRRFAPRLAPGQQSES